MSDEYTKTLEHVIKQMLKPLKDIPFNLVIETISGHKVVPFDKNNNRDKRILENLIKVAEIAGNEINKTGIFRRRPNEVGNDIESFVMNALNSIGYRSSTPKSKSGKKMSMGYPDIVFVDEFKKMNYLECKTFNISNISTTQRSFYLSPSKDFKITTDSHHFVISYEIVVTGKSGTKNIYKASSWKILSLEKLLVNVKYEFNTDNKSLYDSKLVLAEGKLNLNAKKKQLNNYL